MSVAADGFEFLASQMANPETQWSLGTFGAIAEFMRSPDEPVALTRGENSLSAVTPRGGLRIEPPADMRLVAFETTTVDSWAHRIALCLPEARASMSRRTVLTEIGPDAGALREQDRGAILFDLGIDGLQADLHVRIGDPEVAATLRAQVGRSLLEAGNPAMGVIVATGPHRVFASRLGRIEVYQPIPDPNGKSPEGPHTHVLPNLLHHRRTHAATEQIPDGWIPCAHLYPSHPARDGLGNNRPFDPARHAAFQQMLNMFGNPEFTALKQRVATAIAAGEDPSVVEVIGHRFARTNVRVALRQLKAAHEVTPSLAAWMAAHERAGEVEVDDEVRHQHHR
ncbi:MAG: hypothetical protein QOG83_2504 [Alphaproteobacteria bacterium]|nr:hypothetical protein [Alphaproteobacteria bacterium]